MAASGEAGITTVRGGGEREGEERVGGGQKLGGRGEKGRRGGRIEGEGAKGPGEGRRGERREEGRGLWRGRV